MPAYTSAEVARHNSPTDCWVVVHRQVYDVTNFLQHHPGGRAALSKAGRGGQDVSSHFERIGHSPGARALLLQTGGGDGDGRGASSSSLVPSSGKPVHLGSLALASAGGAGGGAYGQGDETNSAAAAAAAAAASPSPSPSPSSSSGLGLLNILGAGAGAGGFDDGDGDAEDEAFAIDWHAKRRRAILAAHPEISRLQNTHNPWTPLIGLAGCAVQVYTCLHCQASQSWATTLLLAATVGALCRMLSFAVCHEVCHKTAGAWCGGECVSNLMYHLFTLPGIGGEMQHYYAVQHRGHHTALGNFPVFDDKEEVQQQQQQQQQRKEDKADDGGVANSIELGRAGGDHARGWDGQRQVQGEEWRNNAHCREEEDDDDEEEPQAKDKRGGGGGGGGGGRDTKDNVEKDGDPLSAESAAALDREYRRLGKFALSELDGDLPSPNALMLLGFGLLQEWISMLGSRRNSSSSSSSSSSSTTGGSTGGGGAAGTTTTRATRTGGRGGVYHRVPAADTEEEEGEEEGEEDGQEKKKKTTTTTTTTTKTTTTSAEEKGDSGPFGGSSLFAASGGGARTGGGVAVDAGRAKAWQGSPIPKLLLAPWYHLFHYTLTTTMEFIAGVVLNPISLVFALAAMSIKPPTMLRFFLWLTKDRRTRPVGPGWTAQQRRKILSDEAKVRGVLRQIGMPQVRE